jgi:trimeric autotransporter adhesin
MTLRFMRALASVGASGVVAIAFWAVGPSAAQAATPAGTSIYNTASASYKDAAGNSYSSTSNQVVAYVQNVPTLTVTTVNGGNANTATGYPVVPGATITDMYTLTNTGNSSGDMQLTADSVNTYTTGTPNLIIYAPSGNLPAACGGTPTATYAYNNLGTAGSAASGTAKNFLAAVARA